MRSFHTSMPRASLWDKELRKKGVTRKLLWEEYKEKHPKGAKSGMPNTVVPVAAVFF